MLGPCPINIPLVGSSTPKLTLDHFELASKLPQLRGKNPSANRLVHQCANFQILELQCVGGSTTVQVRAKKQLSDTILSSITPKGMLSLPCNHSRIQDFPII